MILVTPQPEPLDFDEKVRRKGRSFLATNTRPRGADWKGKEFWRNAIEDLSRAYRKICAYSSLWIPPDQPTIDHYISRDENPNLAYEWNNFRLARWRINTRKNKYNDVLDPFQIENGWFILDFTTFMVMPNSDLSPTLKDQIRTTISRLDLNHEDYVRAREKWFEAFSNDLHMLEEVSPFIAYELIRQR